ncbi:MAG: hypothetical protein NTW87_28800 [Planctomycetota bacterium]|nr:hypothetical protein [Planctomycetota bacterium]
MTPVFLTLALKVHTAIWWGWVALAVIVAGVTLAWLYRTLYKLYSARQATLLLALKLGAVAVLLLGLLRPALLSETRDLLNARVILLVDDSRSMTTHDGTLGRARLEDAKEIVYNKLLPRLEKKLLVTPMAFSDGVRVLEKPDELQGTGEGTDIPRALLDSAKNYSKAGGIGAFVLVTDGGDARALPPALAAGVPVFSLAIGTDLIRSDDLKIGRVEYPEQVDAKTDFEIQVEVSASGRKEFFDALGTPSLSLTESGKPVTGEAVKLSPDTRQRNVTLRVKAPEPGIHRYKLAVPVYRTEAATLNNERMVTVEVRDPSLRVLYYAAELGQEYKPLRNALKADPGIDFTGLIRTGADRFLLQGQRPGDKFGNEFPGALDFLQKFKCIFLSGCEAKDFNPPALKALEQFVSEGGSLVLTGGPRAFGLGGWAATPLAPAFPWQIAASEPPFHYDTVALELTPLGRAHAIFRDLAATLSGGGSVAKFEGYNTPGSLRPGAQALVQAALASGERPAVVASGRYGKGKVLGIATNSLWKWSLAGTEGDKTYDSFWRQAVRYLASSEEGGALLKLSADRQGRYQPGARAAVTARVLDRGLQPLGGAVISGALKQLDGTLIGPVSFREDKPVGTYTAQVDLVAAGCYRLQASASDSKGLLETRELLLEAGAGVGEGSNLGVNSSYLQELATKTGGAARGQDQVGELVDLVLNGVHAKVRLQEVSLLWDTPFYFLLFLALTTCEWVARRRMNLI